MANLNLTFSVHKRWFFWPAFYVIGLLAVCRIVHDFDRAGKWLVDHAMRFEVE